MDQTALSVLKRAIIGGVQGLLNTPSFSQWFIDQASGNGDAVCINNSFIYRKPLIKTSKNDQYLCVKVTEKGVNTRQVFICTPGDFNSDFKLFSAKRIDFPSTESLIDGVKRETKQLGQLVFVLIGELEEMPARVVISHSTVQELDYDTAMKRPVVRKTRGGKTVVSVNQLVDPESAWNAIRVQLEDVQIIDLTGLEAAFAVAFEKLQDEARLRLSLPKPTSTRTDASFLGRLRKSVSEQRSLYEEALKNHIDAGGTEDAYLRDVMRIAYNFSDDAVKVLQLLVSITDLKGILSWCTIKEHFDLAEAFRSLPWSKSDKKPSLQSYRDLIGGARNSAFHNLLAFDRTIDANLDGIKVNARRLTILPSYVHRKGNVPFDYEDREMVEVLGELTRAQATVVPLDFWKKNLKVMTAFEELLKSTEKALWSLISLA